MSEVPLQGALRTWSSRSEAGFGPGGCRAACSEAGPPSAACTDALLGQGLGDVRLPGKGNSFSHGARPVHQIISMIKWIRTNKFPIKKSLSPGLRRVAQGVPPPREGVCGRKCERGCLWEREGEPRRDRDLTARMAASFRVQGLGFKVKGVGFKVEG